MIGRGMPSIQRRIPRPIMKSPVQKVVIATGERRWSVLVPPSPFPRLTKPFGVERQARHSNDHPFAVPDFDRHDCAFLGGKLVSGDIGQYPRHLLAHACAIRQFHALAVDRRAIAWEKLTEIAEFDATYLSLSVEPR